jgi:hypothetical protein
MLGIGVVTHVGERNRALLFRREDVGKLPQKEKGGEDAHGIRSGPWLSH